MASFVPIAPQGGSNSNGQMMQQNNQANESGVQVRPMGLKVHYTFDKEAKVNCLARSSQTFNIQTIPLDDKNSIGVIDLRACVQAVTECSPELATQNDETGFTVYALDYSEPDTPLVGQGMLSWALDSMRGDWAVHPPKMVTGRVTKNLLAVFGGGNHETLEVKLKLTAAGKVQRPEPAVDMIQPAPPTETAMTPTGAAEWNSFIQSNPQIGHSAHVSRVASPALSQGPPANTAQRRNSLDPSAQTNSGTEIQRIAPVPVDPVTVPNQPGSRPSSRSSRKKKPPTGRPRGRPRKKPAEGNTSGYEDGTEGEEAAPVKKRAKTTQIEKAAPNPFTSASDSLRVTASTAGSLRNFRPVAANNEAAPGNHLQEVPRAPTPVPEGNPLGVPARGGPKGPKPRRESSMRKELCATLSNQIPPRPIRALSPSQEDGRSPESPVETPAFSEDSPQDIRSSPPVPRTFMRSSPPPSSPVLPPMPAPQRQNSNLMETETDDLFDEPILQPANKNRFHVRPPPKVMEAVDNTGIPTQVFRIHDGPDGDLVHIQNFNTPHPTSCPAGPPQTEVFTAKNVQKHQPARNPPTRQHPPVTAPTPPPTTDAPDRLSPPPAPEPQALGIGQNQVDQVMMGMDDDLFELVREASDSSESLTSFKANPSIQGSLPPPEPTPGSVESEVHAPRHLGRSQSAGVLALPSIPASEPARPSTLSQSFSTEPPAKIPDCLRRSQSAGLHQMPVTASDPVGPPEAPMFSHHPSSLSEMAWPQSDFPPMPSSPPYKFNKNQVKKHSIKLRLESAIANGEMPPFCTNCGAIETPTWRKIWIQDHEGIPQYVEYSEKPGRITAIEITKRDAENNPLSYRLVKKSLGINDERKEWTEQLLCNPCGIWIVKYRSHRPQDKWDNAFGLLGHSRRKRASAEPNPQAKRARTKSVSLPNRIPENYPAIDPLCPVKQSPPKHSGAHLVGAALNEDAIIQNVLSLLADDGRPIKSMSRSVPGSTHSRASRGSGTVDSPIEMDLDDDLGSTRRLLFPSPRKESTTRTLGEINANVVKTTEPRQIKEMAIEKENVHCEARGEVQVEDDELEALFRSPATAGPSTPPPKTKAATDSTPFKTPTRPTPNHRPITRSVSRSIRSVREMLSPSQQTILQRTPTRTSHGSASVRRSPRLNLDSFLDSPLSKTLTDIMSDPAFDVGTGFDFADLPLLETNPTILAEFSNFLSTDAMMPSSPPQHGSVSFTYNGVDDAWAEWCSEQKAAAEKTKE
ncbi:hypothetical protein F66182_3036 [Fusarium sp. NRRL 66182]|nr:hypothetical protein F66182_3036 [Fusarium sp. NRRL 66182]